jgi:hypothetical protein
MTTWSTKRSRPSFDRPNRASPSTKHRLLAVNSGLIVQAGTDSPFPGQPRCHKGWTPETQACPQFD